MNIVCELLGISSRRNTRLTFSLEALAARSGPLSTTRDGWGAGFYQGRDVDLFREPGAASDSPLVRLLETQGPDTTLVISHIRHATLGAVKLANTQPFVRELAGRTHLFAHNGHLPGISQNHQFSLDRFNPVGETDSEHAYCALMERMKVLWQNPSASPSIEERLALVAAYAADLRQLGPANFLYADGEVLFAHGHRRILATTGRRGNCGCVFGPSRGRSSTQPLRNVPPAHRECSPCVSFLRSYSDRQLNCLDIDREISIS